MALACVGVAAAQPAITLSSPSSGASVSIPGAVSISAAVTPSSGTAIASVSFYQGSVLLSQVTASPYSIAWNPLTPGTYSVQAVAVDSAGGTATSAAVSVTVLAPATTTQVSYTYDSSGRLTAASFGSVATESFSLDASSNHTAVATTDQTTAMLNEAGQSQRRSSLRLIALAADKRAKWFSGRVSLLTGVSPAETQFADLRHSLSGPPDGGAWSFGNPEPLTLLR